MHCEIKYAHTKRQKETYFFYRRGRVTYNGVRSVIFGSDNGLSFLGTKPSKSVLVYCSLNPGVEFELDYNTFTRSAFKTITKFNLLFIHC